jgi:hypothetical protein
MRITADLTGGKPIVVLLQSISGVSAINPLVAFYLISGGKRGAILLFRPGHHTRLFLYDKLYSPFTMGRFRIEDLTKHPI